MWVDGSHKHASEQRFLFERSEQHPHARPDRATHRAGPTHLRPEGNGRDDQTAAHPAPNRALGVLRGARAVHRHQVTQRKSRHRAGPTHLRPEGNGRDDRTAAV